MEFIFFICKELVKNMLMKVVKLVGFAIIFCYILLIVGREFLVISEEPKKADVIIVLSGGVGRLEKAVELYHAGYGDYLMLSRANVPGMTAERAIELGVPKKRLILEEKATSTYNTGIYTKDLMENNQLTSAIIVSSDYHMRRTKLSFERVFKDTEIERTYVASRQVMSDSLVMNKSEIHYTLSELTKYVGYSLGMYHFIDL
ncbi:YdcF family protein [Oceanobacillus zhaokaii]|uniref:YdcF family protein n=1 Tax=Oceanobacillus zhaokaii TaxID=2052660 RepID=A0A345PJY2_9BACI|nr:YdcF family protein [Oceanobacillus zhaokaii]AXI10312.1 YdcF family protein [Oceanobacillus zhaokaii]